MTILRIILRNNNLIGRSFSRNPRVNVSLLARPSPPKLPKEQQEEFERLQKQSVDAFQVSHLDSEGDTNATQETVQHRDLRKGAEPEFEGEKNPKTGEVGGPKNDPLHHNEWTYNGRVTDF